MPAAERAVSPLGSALSVVELKPEAIYLRDKDGNLVLVPGFTLEDVLRLYEKQQQLDRAAQPSLFNLQRLSVDGRVAGDRAELRAELAAVIQGNQWVRVPIGLGHAALSAPAQYEGDGDYLLEFDAAAGGYVAWFRGGEGKPHRLKLDLLVPVVQNGDQWRLRLSAPRATTSELSIRIPIARPALSTSTGVHVVSSEAAGADATRVRAIGLGPDFELAWREASRPMAEAPKVVESTAAVRVMIDSQTIRSDATLTVRSFASPLESIRVRLPAGTELEPASQPSYTMTLLDPPEANGSRIVEVQLRRPSSEPVVVRLMTRRSRSPSELDETINLAGFEVLGAVRQGGYVAVSVDGDWRAVWQDRQHVREVDQLPESLPPDPLHVAGFEFFRQPFSLAVQALPRQTRVAVEPTYRVRVEAERLVLEAQLSFKVRGARVSQFELAIDGWEVDSVESSTTIRPGADLSVADGRLTIPLAQRVRAPVEIVLRAHRPIDPAAGQIDFALPRPVADLISPATLLVEAAENVELTPLTQQIAGLVPRQVAAPSSRTAERPQERWLYREANGAEPPRFAAGIQLQARRILVQNSADILFDEHASHIDQTLTYRVDYEPVDRLLLDVPRAVADGGDMTMTIGTLSVTPSRVPDRTGGTADSSAPMVRMSVPLPAPTLEPVRLRIRYRAVETAAMPPKARRNVPLIQPVDAAEQRQQVRLLPSDSVRVVPADPRWTSVRHAQPGTSGTLHLVAGGQADSILAEVEPRPRRTDVRGAWYQTWLAGDVRQDRAVFHFSTNDQRLSVFLPPDVRADQVAVWLDGAAVVPQREEAAGDDPQGNRRLWIPLESRGSDRAGSADAARPVPRTARSDTDPSAWAASASREPTDHVLELVYTLSADGRADRSALEVPQLDSSAWVERTYWQLVLPSNEHLVASPDGFTSEHDWGWRPLIRWQGRPLVNYWGRRAKRYVAQGQPVAALRTAEELPSEVNVYLFSRLGPPTSMGVRSASRSAILLAASGSVLLCGLTLIYFPAARRPGVLLACAVALGAAALLRPDWSVLVAQAASLGLVLTAGAVMLYRATAAGGARHAPLRGASSGVIERSSAHQRPRSEGTSQITTRTAPADIEVTAPDVKP